MPGPGAGDVTVIDPVGVTQVVGLVALAVGGGGAVGAGLTVTGVGIEIHPALF